MVGSLITEALVLWGSVQGAFEMLHRRSHPLVQKTAVFRTPGLLHSWPGGISMHAAAQCWEEPFWGQGWVSWASVARRTSVTPPGEELVWSNRVLSPLVVHLGSLPPWALSRPRRWRVLPMLGEPWLLLWWLADGFLIGPQVCWQNGRVNSHPIWRGQRTRELFFILMLPGSSC